jgi:hypothetical protein
MYQFKYDEDDRIREFKTKDDLIDFLCYSVIGSCTWTKRKGK